MTTPRVGSVHELVETLRDAWNRHDMRAYTAWFGRDAIYVNAIGMIWRGHAEIERGHLRLHEAVFSASTITSMEHTESNAAPGVAVCVCEWEMTGAAPPEGWTMGQPRRGVMTLVLVKEDGTWTIASGQNTEKNEIDIPE
jgi:uncharacterized protein (TIGR02246 family)